MPSLVEIGPMVLEKLIHVYIWTNMDGHLNRQTINYRCFPKRTWAPHVSKFMLATSRSNVLRILEKMSLISFCNDLDKDKKNIYQFVSIYLIHTSKFEQMNLKSIPLSLSLSLSLSLLKIIVQCDCYMAR